MIVIKEAKIILFLKKKLTSYVSTLTVLFFGFSLAQTETKAKSLNGKPYSKDKINTKSDMYEVEG